VEQILRTGDRSARVERPNTEDELDELVTLFNAMLDQNERLIKGMRDSLDHMAHDMRTPLTRLRGEAELALNGSDLNQMQEALADAIEESDRLSEMLKTIMDISEAECGATRLDMTNVPLEPLVRSLFDLYEGVAEDRQITLEMRIDPKGFIYADRNRLQMVLSNLLDNAIKYTPPNTGGRVVVTAEFGSKSVRVMVRDSGQGISDEDLPRIWERLYRGDQSRSEKGLGLGLSLVRALVEAQGGRVSVESAQGKGSTFIVIMPRKVTPPAEEVVKSGGRLPVRASQAQK
jgi:signal transduction histidine kinase